MKFRDTRPPGTAASVGNLQLWGLRHHRLSSGSPGGAEKISLAAGSSLEAYWAVFAIHNTNEVKETLESLRIGNIAKEDRVKISQQAPKGRALCQ